MIKYEILNGRCTRADIAHVRGTQVYGGIIEMWLCEILNNMEGWSGPHRYSDTASVVRPVMTRQIVESDDRRATNVHETNEIPSGIAHAISSGMCVKTMGRVRYYTVLYGVYTERIKCKKDKTHDFFFSLSNKWGVSIIYVKRK